MNPSNTPPLFADAGNQINPGVNMIIVRDQGASAPFLIVGSHGFVHADEIEWYLREDPCDVLNILA